MMSDEEFRENLRRLQEILDQPDTRDLTRKPDKNKGCFVCQHHKACYDAFMDHAVLCGAYGVYETTIDMSEGAV